ncbi:MAG: glycosyl hydrolase [Saprospiraceae bacterium]|nr:glycosyl hydrolase [Saprospiraceae bacterium]
MKKFLSLSLLLFFAILVCTPTSAQETTELISKEQLTDADESIYAGMQWRQVGPFRGGRAGTVAGVPGKPNLFYQGTAGGGVWRTQDGGGTWECISDGYFGGSIGAIAVSEKDPNVIYVGEGEQTVRGNVSSGRGLWKSVDAGKTWSHIGLDESEHIGRIRIHPDNPNVVYVAAMGNLWKPNEQRGLFRSTDGGASWEKILYVSDKAGAVDVVLDPNNSRIMYCGTWQIKRNGYRMDSGGPGSKLWKSTDGGDTWTDLSNQKGLPEGVWGIVGVTVSHVNSNRVWTIIEAEDGGVFRSDDGGQTWRKTNSDRGLRQRAWYYSRIYADTQDEDIVYVMNVRYFRSKDGGETFDQFNAPHGDHHDLWIAPEDNQRMVIADDGGAQVSYDGGANWSTYYNQPTAQFYRVTTDNHFPFRILGAQQDNSTVRISHRSKGNAITERDWEPSAGGESAHLAPDPENPEIVYGGTYKGYMSRYDHTTGQTRSVNVWPDNPAGSGVEVMKYRFNWNFPVLFSPHNPDRLYACSNYLHVTTNEGQSWQVISPDLTRNDPKTLHSSGGPITQDNTGVEFYGTIFACEESPHEEGVIYAGSDDGLMHVTKDGGKNWTDITPPGAPSNLMVNCIDVDPLDPAGVYMAGTSYKFGDYKPYLYVSKDYGKTWKKIVNGIESTHYTRAIRADTERPGLLFAGTEWAMYVSFDDGNHWQPFQLNLPIVAIRDLQVRDHSLIAATHGRSFWMIDDLSPLRQLSRGVAQKSEHIFQPKPAYRMAGGGRGRANPKLQGTNHPNGVQFHFFTKDLDPEETVKLEILEEDGDVIRTYSSTAKKSSEKLTLKGESHAFNWDMRYPGFKEFPGMVLYSSPNRGPRAIPGTYRARLTRGDATTESNFSIVPDPRLETTQEEYQQQFDFLIRVRDKVSEAHQAILDIRSIKKDFDYLASKLDKEDPDHKTLMDKMDMIKDSLTILENTIHMTKNQSFQDPLNYGIRLNNRLAFLMADQQRGDFPPTDQAEEFRVEVSADLDRELAKVNEIFSTEIPAINQTLIEQGISILQVTKKEVKP